MSILNRILNARKLFIFIGFAVGVIVLAGCTKQKGLSGSNSEISAMQMTVSGNFLSTQLSIEGTSSVGGLWSEFASIHMPSRLNNEQRTQVLHKLFLSGGLAGEVFPDISFLSGGNNIDTEHTTMLSLPAHILGLSGHTFTLKNARLLQSGIGVQNILLEEKNGDLVFTLTGREGKVLLQNTVDEALMFFVGGSDGQSIYLGPGEYMILSVFQDTAFGHVELFTSGMQSMKSRLLDHSLRKEAWESKDNTTSLTIKKETAVVSPGRSYTISLGKAKGNIEMAELYMVNSSPITDEDATQFGIDAQKSQKFTEVLEKAGYDISDVDLKHLTLTADIGKAFALNTMTVVPLKSTLSDAGYEITLPEYEGMYMMYLRDKNGFDVLLPILATRDFGFSMLTPEDNTQEMNMIFRGNFPFDVSSISEQLNGILGNDAFTIVPFINSEESKTSHTLRIEYRIPPQERKTGVLQIKNIFGQTHTYDLNLYVKEIPNQFRHLIVQGGGINLLPSKGYRNNKIEVQTKNQPNFTLYYQSCAGVRPFAPDAQTTGLPLEATLINCEGEVYKQEYVFDAQRRKMLSHEVELPASIAGSNTFRVSTNPEMSQSKYFVHTNLGIYSKFAENKLSVRVFSLDEGKQKEDAELRLFDNEGNEIQSTTRKESKGVLDLTEYKSGILRLEARIGDESTWIILLPENNGRYSYTNVQGEWLNRQSLAYVETYDLFTDAPKWRRDNGNTIKVYGYADRGLYKLGDTVNFAGFVRDLSKAGTQQSILSGNITVMLSDVQGMTVSQQTISRLDDFGGFTGSFLLPSAGSLGTYYMQYQFNGQQYSHDIRVEEYQKPTFFIDQKLELKDDAVVMTFTPEYYFGSALKSYNMTVGYSVVTNQEWCRECRWQNDEEYYYNHIFDQNFTTGSNVIYTNVSQPSIEMELFKRSDIPQRGYKLRIKADVKVTDLLSDETHQESRYLDLEPEVRIGLQGQPVDRLGNTDTKNYVVEGDIAEGRGKVDHLEYVRYRQIFGDDSQRGVDGSRYYMQGNEFLEIMSGSLKSSSSFEVPGGLSGAGTYFLKVIARDEKGNSIGEVQKRIMYYDWSSYDGMYMGRLRNNYVLAVQVPRKTYAVGENIPVHIDPYVKGATAVVTVERGSSILDSYVIQLDGDELTIPVKQGYAPNINISVTQMIGENLNVSQQRKEPRLLMGYAQASISEDDLHVKMTLSTDKEVYEPGEEATVTIRTTDNKDNPVDARVSLGVVDKSLADLYHLIKEPIPYFYNKIGSFVMNVTNMKYLYQALRVFVADGSKGGGGGGDLGLLGALRDEFLEVAFWNGAVYTKNGEAKVTFRIPDNLTTRLVDAIAVTKDTKLATTTTIFTVNKPLLLQPNLPQFLSLGDKLDIPVSVNVPDARQDKVSSSVELSAQAEVVSGEFIDLGSLTTQKNTKVLLSIELPDTLLGKESVTLWLHAKAGDYRDDLKVTVPLRSEGLVQKSFGQATAKEGTIEIPFTSEQRTTSSIISVSTVPVRAFETALSYLLHYPYGCTEQLLSSLYPLAVAYDLQEAGLLGNRLIQGDKVLLGGVQGWQDRKKAVEDGINKLVYNQQPDGGFAYWTEGNSEYALSAYVYGVLRLLQKQDANISADVMTRLETYLEQGMGTNTQGYLYYLFNKVRAGDTVNIADVEDIVKTHSDNEAMKVMGFVILAMSDKKEEAKTLLADIDLNTYTGPEDARGHGAYLDPDILEAFLLRGMVALGDTEGSRDLVSKLLVKRNVQDEGMGVGLGNGLRGRSTQKNVQIMLALGAYLRSTKPQGSEIVCTVKRNGVSENITIPTNTRGAELTKQQDDTKKIVVERSCPQEILIDVATTHMPKNTDDIPTQQQGIEITDATMSPKSPAVGENVKISTSFVTEKRAERVAVEIFIPSTLKLWETISKKSSAYDAYNGRRQNTLPFDVQGDRQCYPQHYEIRYDRVFLYYDHLDEGIRCEIKVDALQAYEGESFPGQVRIREMYKTDVWGNRQLQGK